MALGARTRDTNLGHLRALVTAPSEQEYQAACRALAADFHPSFYAEIDWWEEVAWPTGEPEEQKRERMLLSDGVDTWVDRAPPLEPVEIDALAAGARPWRMGLATTQDVAAANELHRALATATERAAAKDFLRGHRDRFGRRPTVDVRDAARRAELEAAVEGARAAGLDRWIGLALPMLGTDPDVLPAPHHVASGDGPCSRCAMHFASATVVFVDSRDLQGGDDEDGVISIPLWLGCPICPFCGTIDRIGAPTIFYHRGRRQRVYLLPTGEDDVTAAVERFGSVVNDIQAAALAELDQEERAAFLAATELVVTSPGAYLHALHMGETVTEDHAWTKVTSGGSSWIMDVTKGVLIQLTPTEAAWSDEVDP